jgi:hypothetical protein
MYEDASEKKNYYSCYLSNMQNVNREYDVNTRYLESVINYYMYINSSLIDNINTLLSFLKKADTPQTNTFRRNSNSIANFNTEDKKQYSTKESEVKAANCLLHKKTHLVKNITKCPHTDQKHYAKVFLFNLEYV